MGLTWENGLIASQTWWPKPVVLHITKARQKAFRELKASYGLQTWLYFPKSQCLDTAQ